ncbi:MAG: hypothetical protein F6K19_35230 [Cyanothece sp. SIO1E1]|nr:hypothetical protein [Cyanothece sp. SIO1E1]
MHPSFQGIPSIPDLTHPHELIEFGGQITQMLPYLAIFVIALGIVMALLLWADRSRGEARQLLILQDWLEQYFFLLKHLSHFALVLVILVGGFFLCSTLANRYHDWEQARVAQVAEQVAGSRLEQTAPRIRYQVEEPYTYTTVVEGELVQVEEIREVPRFLAIASSQIQVTLDQAQAAQNLRAVYMADFQADYEVTNPLEGTEDFFFEINPPYGYSLLQNFRVQQDETRLVPVNPGGYSFPLRLPPGETTHFRVAYQAQGGPRWVYSAGQQLLANFRLTALANFAKADFASGIVPTESKMEGRGTRFTWVFDDNVSVRNPFGVFTATEPVRNTGILPRLLLLAPALFLWWLLLLYLSLPMTLENVAIAAGTFFACLLTLTYFSRLIDVKLAWTLISLVLLILAWGLGTTRPAKLAALICTIAGGVVPVWGLIIPYSGLTLSLAGLLSVIWLVARHWYGWQTLHTG